MLYRIAGYSSLLAALIVVLGCGELPKGEPGNVPTTDNPGNPQAKTKLFNPRAPINPEPADPARRSGGAVDPIVIHDCRLTVQEREEVPSQREGVILFIGTEVKDEEWDKLPENLKIKVKMGDTEKKYRRLREGDTVVPGQLMAQLDNRLASDDYSIKEAKKESAKADLVASEKTRDEAEQRFFTIRKLREKFGERTAPDEEVRGAKLTHERYIYEVVSKKAAVQLSNLEHNQSKTVLDMHEIRSSINGIIKAIYKKPGESIKSLEPVFQIQCLDCLRVEGLVDIQYVPRLKSGMKVVVEPTESDGPVQTLYGHLHEVNGVAVSKDAKNPLVVSASEDGTVRIWDRAARRERRIVRIFVPIRSVACTPPGADANLCLSGALDGKARIWNLDDNNDQPRELSGKHGGAVTCVAFSPDGKTCVTGGDDRQIFLWDTATGERRYAFPAGQKEGHRGAITSLTFTPNSQLISAARDNTLRLWNLSEQSAEFVASVDRRSGDVTQLGISPDGKRVLFDQGKVLRLMSLPGGLTEGTLRNPTSGHNFTTFALFSPDGKTILTAGAPEGRLQLWRAPTASTRGYEIRQLVPTERGAASCAAFAPDGSFIVSGTKDRQVMIWPVPTKEEIERQLTAPVVLIERSVESTSHQVRIWAEIQNPDARLIPGSTVTMAVYPE